MSPGIDRRALAALSGSHLTTDFAAGVLPALIPFLHDRFHLSYLMAGVLVLASTVSSSVIQPLFGLWSDRRGALWLLPAGVLVSGVGIGLAADAPSFWLVCLLVVVSGLGVAAFHPEASKVAAYASGARRSSGMSMFYVGGNVGSALGPAIVVPLVVFIGLRGGLLVALPGIACAAGLLTVWPRLSGLVTGPAPARIATGENRPGAVAVLIGMVTCRSVTWFGLLTFVPLWERTQGHSKTYGDLVLTLMLLAGAIGTLALGPLADRIGGRRVLVASQALVCPLALLYVLVGGAVGIAALVPLAACIVGTFGVTIVMSQQYLPHRIGVASGLAIGFSIGLGGLAAVALGGLADVFGLRSALLVAALAPLLGLALASRLPRPVAHPGPPASPMREDAGLNAA